MKANELMIGDWVRHKRTKEVISIFEIDDDRNVINNEPDGYCSEKNIDIDDVEPIPLTPETLEKNGFSAFQMDFSCCLWNVYEVTNVLHIAICGEKMFFGYYHGDKDGNDTIEPLFDIYYVHELQHALKLCHIEKTIEL